MLFEILKFVRKNRLDEFSLLKDVSQMIIIYHSAYIKQRNLEEKYFICDLKLVSKDKGLSTPWSTQPVQIQLSEKFLHIIYINLCSCLKERD